jgi:uncharacterized protein with von Willebrand factor type A (vWA) domain
LSITSERNSLSFSAGRFDSCAAAENAISAANEMQAISFFILHNFGTNVHKSERNAKEKHKDFKIIRNFAPQMTVWQ